jgi:hypothetical protein
VEEQADMLQPLEPATRATSFSSSVHHADTMMPAASGGSLLGMGHQRRERELAAITAAHLQPLVASAVSSHMAGIQVGACLGGSWRAGVGVLKCLQPGQGVFADKADADQVLRARITAFLGVRAAVSGHQGGHNAGVADGSSNPATRGQERPYHSIVWEREASSPEALCVPQLPLHQHYLRACIVSGGVPHLLAGCGAETAKS